MAIDAKFVDQVLQDVQQRIVSAEKNGTTPDVLLRQQQILSDKNFRQIFDDLILATTKKTMSDIQDRNKDNIARALVETVELVENLSPDFVHILMTSVLASFHLGYEVRKAEQEVEILEKF